MRFILPLSYEKTKNAQENYNKIMRTPVKDRKKVFDEIKKDLSSKVNLKNTKLADEIYKLSPIKNAQENYNKIMKAPLEKRQEIFNDIKTGIESSEVVNSINSNNSNNSNSVDYKT